MLKVKPQGFVGRLADMLMLPTMYLLQGTVTELPQRTHRWNNDRYIDDETISYIKTLPLVDFTGVPSEEKLWLGFIPRFHMPIFGGWRTFVVLSPRYNLKPWFVGWVSLDSKEAGISRIPLKGAVRMTLGPGPVAFFGITQSGTPLQLIKVEVGRIGQAGKFYRVPLL